MPNNIIQQNIVLNDITMFPPIYGENIESLHPEIQLSLELITPEVAQKMLETNINNRDINNTSIVLKVLQDDEWELNGATIVFDKYGALRDGQHRLYACVKTNKPIDTVVVRGVEPDSQITMDTGTRRALRDYTKIQGYPNYSLVATMGLALYVVDAYGFDSYFLKQRGGRATYKAVINFINKNYDLRISPIVADIQGTQRKYKHVNTGVLASLYDAFRAAGEDNYRAFINQLLGKSAACLPVRMLQSSLEKQSSTTDRSKRLTDKFVAAYFIKVWNAYMRGDDIKMLRFSQGGSHPESFPVVFLGYDAELE